MRSDSYDRKRVVTSDLLERLGLEKRAGAAESLAASAPLVSARIIAALVRTGEGVLITSYGILLWFIYVQGETTEEFLFYLPLIAGAATALPLLLQAGGPYSIHALLRPVDHVARLAAGWALIASLVLSGLFLAKFGAVYSRLWVIGWFAGALGLLVLFRLIIARLVRRWNAKGQLDWRAVLVGGGEPAGELIEALES